jgi:sorting nexin-8
LFGKSDPWAPSTSPTGTDRGRRISSLLANALIPSIYTSLYEEGKDESSGKVSLRAFRALLERSKVAPSQKERIMWIVTHELAVVDSVSPNVWNIAMALIGLAQQGEELDLDTVDAFRNRLPIINLGESPTTLNTAPSTVSDVTGTSASSSGWDVDQHANGSLKSSVVFDGSFSGDIKTSREPMEATSDIGPGMSGSSLVGGGLVNPSNSINVAEPAWTPKISDPGNYNPSSKSTINVQLVPEREGMFMFRHVVYILEGHIPGKTDKPFKVVRRYSDFLWLLECLVKRYPFRLLPVLPPKRLTVDGNYLSSDTSFLERRRRGLSRFVNQLVKHPVLRAEQLVTMFLTVDTELSVWRKQSNVNIEEEFRQRVISPAFTAKWNQQQEMEKWRSLNEAVTEGLQSITHICHLVDRIAKRNEAMGLDVGRLSNAIGNLEAGVPGIFRQATDDLPAIRTGLRSASRHLSNMGEFFGDESRAVDIGILEDLKLFRDMFSSIKEMFVRFDRLGGNSIGRLQKRIEANDERLRVLASKPEASASDISKIRQSITSDKESIQRQTNRDWLIKECITEEIALAQKMQYQISRFLGDWSIDNLKYSELHTETWSRFNDEVSDMPQDI